MNNSEEIKFLPHDTSYIVDVNEKNLINELFPKPKNKFVYKIISSAAILISIFIVCSDAMKRMLSNFFPQEMVIVAVAFFLFTLIKFIIFFEEK